MQKNNPLSRLILCTIGLFLLSLGVALTKHADLGVTPISSVPNVLSLYFSKLTLGNWVILWNVLLILGQIAILRHRFEHFQWLQLPLSFLFGFFVDLSLYLIRWIPHSLYLHQLIILAAGIIILSIGVSITVIADFILNSGEAFVQAISSVTKKSFGPLKILFDSSCVLISIILSLILFSFRVFGTREGTVLSALLVGGLVHRITPILKPPLTRLFQLED